MTSLKLLKRDKRLLTSFVLSVLESFSSLIAVEGKCSNVSAREETQILVSFIHNVLVKKIVVMMIFITSLIVISCCLFDFILVNSIASV